MSCCAGCGPALNLTKARAANETNLDTRKVLTMLWPLWWPMPATSSHLDAFGMFEIIYGIINSWKLQGFLLLLEPGVCPFVPVSNLKHVGLWQTNGLAVSKLGRKWSTVVSQRWHGTPTCMGRRRPAAKESIPFLYQCMCITNHYINMFTYVYMYFHMRHS